MKLLIYSTVAFCFLCHHHLFHRHAKACGGVQAVAVQSFALAAPCGYQPTLAYYQPQPVLLADQYPAAVVLPAERAPRRQVIKTRTVVRTSF